MHSFICSEKLNAKHCKTDVYGSVNAFFSIWAEKTCVWELWWWIFSCFDANRCWIDFRRLLSQSFSVHHFIQCFLHSPPFHSITIRCHPQILCNAGRRAGIEQIYRGCKQTSNRRQISIFIQSCMLHSRAQYVYIKTRFFGKTYFLSERERVSHPHAVNSKPSLVRETVK